MRKSRRMILLAAIVLSLAGVGFKVVQNIQLANKEIKKDPTKVLDYLPESSLNIKEFHRAKIENGRKVWELFGDEASYFKEQREAVVKRPRFYYYDKKGEVAETTGAEARVFLKEKELERMELSGGIEVTFQGYVLKSAEAKYLPAEDQIHLPQHTTVVGEGLALEGASMEVELESKKIRLIRDVKTMLEPHKLSKKHKSKSDAPIGG